jgi:Arc/MetJ-type ribon-helix-helix transcriptional regulator
MDGTAQGVVQTTSRGESHVGYHSGMTKQIAVRLPDELVKFIDELVAHGQAPSRAAVVAQAIERERRREIAARDAAILARAEPDKDLDELAEFAARTPMDDLA